MTVQWQLAWSVLQWLQNNGCKTQLQIFYYAVPCFACICSICPLLVATQTSWHASQELCRQYNLLALLCCTDSGTGVGGSGYGNQGGRDSY